MKKCPKCKAEIQEEARFCLYCMTSFEEKQTVETPKELDKRWLYIIAAVLVVILVVFSFVIFVPKGNKPNNLTDNSNSSSFSSDSNTSTDNNDTISSEQQGDESTGGESSSPSSSSQILNSSKNVNNTPGNTTTNNISTNSSPQSDSSRGNTTTNITTSNNSDSSSATTATPSESTPITYLYRDAKRGDDYSVNANLENSVVITGVKTASANGEYKIPDTIDGKKVVAIMRLAFCDESIRDTVKKVIVPATVKTIWDYAFAYCGNLTDIYFCGDAVYTGARVFPESPIRKGAITIHCSADCSDRDFRTYKNYITNYLNGALNDYSILYEEWNYEG